MGVSAAWHESCSVARAMPDTNLTIAAFVVTFLGVAIADIGCGSTSTTGQAPTDAAAETAGDQDGTAADVQSDAWAETANPNDSGSGSDGTVTDGMIDSAQQVDARLDAVGADSPDDTGALPDASPPLDAADAQPSQDAADARPDVSGGACTPFGQCACDADAATCPSACVRTVCGPPSSCACSAPQAICVDPQNGTCDCGFVLNDHCVKPASHCLCTSCGDAPGAICVTDAQQSEVCYGPFRSAFACP
jgi:hypothetical protein